MKKLITVAGRRFLLTILIFAITACAGSRKASDEEAKKMEDDYIAELLGIKKSDSDKSTQNDTQSKDKDDLLDLLKEPEKAADSSVVNGSLTAASDDKTKNNSSDRDELLKLLTPTPPKPKTDRETVTSVAPAAPPPVAPSKDTSVKPLSTSSFDSYESEYNAAFNLFQHRKYRDAIKAFEALLAKNTTHSLADNAQYWIGESYYALGDYSAAIVAFEKVFTFKNSNKNDYAQFKIGQCYYMLKDYNRARQEFQKLIDNYKNSNLISYAEKYLRKM
jgi:TolA-binding protein